MKKNSKPIQANITTQPKITTPDEKIKMVLKKNIKSVKKPIEECESPLEQDLGNPARKYPSGNEGETHEETHEETYEETHEETYE